MANRQVCRVIPGRRIPISPKYAALLTFKIKHNLVIIQLYHYMGGFERWKTRFSYEIRYITCINYKPRNDIL